MGYAGVAAVRDQGICPRSEAARNPAVRLAQEAGSEKAANTVMLGVLAALGLSGVAVEHYRAAVADNFAGRQKLVDMNNTAIALAEEWTAKQAK